MRIRYDSYRIEVDPKKQRIRHSEKPSEYDSRTKVM